LVAQYGGSFRDQRIVDLFQGTPRLVRCYEALESNVVLNRHSALEKVLPKSVTPSTWRFSLQSNFLDVVFWQASLSSGRRAGEGWTFVNAARQRSLALVRKQTSKIGWSFRPLRPNLLAGGLVMNQREFEADLRRQGYQIFYGGLQAGMVNPTTHMIGMRASWWSAARSHWPVPERLKHSVAGTAARLPLARCMPSVSARKVSPTSPDVATLSPEHGISALGPVKAARNVRMPF
jgi:hypothetical protein